MSGYAPVEILRQRLNEKERIIMVSTLCEERVKRGVPSMLQTLGDKYDWRYKKIVDNSRGM